MKRAGTVPSNQVRSDSRLDVIIPSLGNRYTATCWIKSIGKWTFTTTNIANAISSYIVEDAGSLTLKRRKVTELDALLVVLCMFLALK